MDFIDLSTLLSFIVTCAIIELTPGPNMAYLAVLSASDGRKAGFAATAGIALGLLGIGLAAAIGLAALISSSPLAYEILRWGGVLYLFWLAWDGWKEETETSASKIQSSTNNRTFFKRGLIINLLNPKAAVFYIAILPKFLMTPSSVISQTITLTVTYVIVATLIHGSIVVLAGSAHKFLQDHRRRMIARRALSFALALIAIWFAFKTGRH